MALGCAKPSRVPEVAAYAGQRDTKRRLVAPGGGQLRPALGRHPTPLGTLQMLAQPLGHPPAGMPMHRILFATHASTLGLKGAERLSLCKPPDG